MIQFVKFLILFIFLTAPCLGISQTPNSAYQKELSLTLRNETLIQVLYDLEQKSEVKFMFSPSTIPYFAIDKDFSNETILTIVRELTNGSLIEVVVYDDNTIILVETSNKNRSNIINIRDKWQDGTYSYPILDEQKDIFYSSITNLELIDKDSGDGVVGALIFNQDTSYSLGSDAEGKVYIQNIGENDSIYIRYLGYQDIRLIKDANAAPISKIVMERRSLNLNAIQISAKSSKAKLQETKIGVTSLTTAQLESIPQVTGEKDLLKSLEILPGVTTSGELSGGINVRGGRIDESLILFNDAIIFNPTHVVGFISGFNADIIESAELYKGYVAPEFGNRSSAVLDMNGSYGADKMRVNAALGTSQLKGSIEGPIGKKATYALSARGSFSDYILNATGIPELRKSSANFYDVYAATSYKLGNRHKLLFSSYYSDDSFIYNEQYGFEWNNFFVNGTYESRWSDKLFSSISLTNGSYQNRQFTFDPGSSYTYNNAINYVKAAAKINRYFGEESYLSGGIEAINYNTTPEILEPFLDGSAIVKAETPRNGSISLAPFLVGKWKINSLVQVEGGVRYSNYFAAGQHIVHEYESDLPEENTISSTKDIAQGEIFHRSAILEPRASVNFQLLNRLSLKLGYGKLSQNAQLVRLANTSIPTDLWIFSNQYIDPRIVNQYSSGLFWLNHKENLNISTSVFTKRTSSFFVLKDFPTIIGNPHLETELLAAAARSYGIEFQLEYNTPKWNLFTAYSYSKSQFQSNDQRGIINRGEWYNGDIDIPHQLNILATYKLAQAIKFNSALTYKSGRPITAPIGGAPIDGVLIPLFGDRNQFRIPSYFRMDLTMNMDLRKLKNKGLRSNFTAGFYNITGNQNAFNVFFRTSDIGTLESYKFSVIGQAIPSISWNIIID